MSKRTFTDEQIVKILEEGERTQESKAEFCRRHGISESGYNYWKKQFQGEVVPSVQTEFTSWNALRSEGYYTQSTLPGFASFPGVD